MENYYHKMVLDLMKSGKCPESKVIEMNEIVDKKAMELIRKEHKNLYWEILRDIHECCAGPHYNESFAAWEVNQMSHIDKNGAVHNGVHWPLEKVKEVYGTYKAHLKPTDTLGDFFVAIHSWYHDNICQDKQDFGENAETKNLERGINYFFKDTDAPEGKIWHYYKGMRKA